MTRRGFILFALLGVGWGIPYLLIKIAVGQLDPAMLVFTRMALAAAVLLPVAAARGELVPVLRRWRPLLAFTVVEMVVPQFLLGSAEERLPSSTTGLLIAAVPLAGVGVAFLLGRPERLAPRNWLGIALGMAGVAALVGFAVSASDLGAFGEVLLVVAGYALGPAILAKWMPGLPGTGVMALGFTLTAAVYAPVVAATHSWPSAWPSSSVIVSVVLLARRVQRRGVHRHGRPGRRGRAGAGHHGHLRQPGRGAHRRRGRPRRAGHRPGRSPASR